jgi:small-conductance mechanosensitive channel
MTQSLGISSGVSASASLLIRTLVAIVLLTALFYIIRQAIVTFTGEKSLQLGRKWHWLFGVNLLAIVILFLIHSVVESALRAVGKSVEILMPFIEPGYPEAVFSGVYYTLLSTLILILLIQVIGAVFWAIEGRLDRWAQRQAEFPPTSLRRHMRKGFSSLNQAFRVTALVFLVLVYISLIMRHFPGTNAVVEALEGYLGKPAQDIGQAIFNYLPNLGYLAVITGLGWLMRKLLKYFFHSLGDGSLTLSGFLPEWADPTYKLCRTVLFLFLLMMSLPYFPGANSEFFKGFSVFVGALVTFGSTGAISNIVSGFVLTYTRAFHVGDMVKIGETVGMVLEKATLTTKLRTVKNEEITIPNGNVLSSTVVNFTAFASTEGLALTVAAGIGYDVDWRKVEALMIDAAKRSENILENPAPFVLKTDLGNYAVNYELFAWTNLVDRPDRMVRISSDLRRNVLDAFNAAGVEIMTPSVLAHRDASGLAIPTERLPERPAARGIAVDLRSPHSTGL